MYMALELSQSKWLVCFSVGGEKKRRVSVAARDLGKLLDEVEKAKRHFKVAEGARVRSCYEAGRDGFWLHRALTEAGIESFVVDSSSIQVERKFRRVKTDRVDVEKLLSGLVELGTPQGKFHVVRVPTPEEEDARHRSRQIERLTKERTAHTNRIKSLLTLQGVDWEVGPEFLEELESVRLFDGSGVAPGLKATLRDEYERYELVEQQLKRLRKQREESVRKPVTASAKKARKLSTLKGVGPTSADTLTREFFGWRKFHNRREVGAAAGLTGTPYDSGESTREQGISKAGNRRVRVVMVELAWRWLKWQPDSPLSQWFLQRFGPAGRRARRVGIVALARKLLIAFWRFIEQDVVPAGATVKPLPMAA